MRSLTQSTASPIDITLLGCGTSTGVPLLFCDCKVCRSKNPKNNRTRSSIWVRTQGKSILVDTSTDLRQQALRTKIPRIDAILYTHPHSDHVSGIDEVRGFNYIQKATIPAFGNAWTVHDLRARYPYLFTGNARNEGGGIALIDLQEFSTERATLDIAGVAVTPISVQHGKYECVGYRFGNFAYVTDCSEIPPASLDRLRDLDLLVLDCLRLVPHGTHFHLDQALAIVRELRPKRTVLTHLGHDFDYVSWTRRGKHAKLPAGVTLAFDGMKLQA